MISTSAFIPIGVNSSAIFLEIWSAVKTLKNDTGLAILIIDKSIKELRQICDRVVILEKGSTVWQGKIDQLSSKITQEFIGV